MKRKHWLEEEIRTTVVTFLFFFAASAFMVTCCFLVFLHAMDLPEDQVREFAPITFWNIVLLTCGFVGLDIIQRKIKVDRPVKKIKKALQEITGGDFTVRLDGSREQQSFAEIMDSINCMTEELSGVETLRSDFIANVSHELKTPLSVIQNYGMLLQDPEISEETRTEYAVAITKSARNLADLITNILKLNRLENQQIFPQTRDYDLGEQLAECILQFEQQWEDKQIELEIDLAEDVKVRQDMELMAIVWNNLLSNAFKFTEPGGAVSVTMTVLGEEAVVSIRDTGCGMSPEVGAHIFEKFYQGDTSHATKGNGLGLALVKRIIDITGGSISVSSVAGAGSTFIVKLMRYNEESVETSESRR